MPDDTTLPATDLELPLRGPALTLVKPSRGIVVAAKDVDRAAQGVLDAVRAGTLEQYKEAQQHEFMAEVVFAYWNARHRRRKSWYDTDRRRLLLKWLRATQGDWGLLLYAIDGALKDDYHMSRNRRNQGTARNGLMDLFGTLEHIEQLAELCPTYRAGQEHPLLAKYRPDVQP